MLTLCGPSRNCVRRVCTDMYLNFMRPMCDSWMQYELASMVCAFVACVFVCVSVREFGLVCV